MRRLDIGGTLFVLIWTSGYVVGAVAAKHAPPLAINVWRIGIAAAVLALIAVRSGARWPRDPRTFAAIGGVGVLLFAVQFGGLYLGLGRGMPAGTSALIISCCPLLVAASLALVGVERLAPRQWLGAALGMAGVVLALADRVSQPRSITPVLWTLLGLTGFVVGTLLQRRLPRDLDARVMGAVECAAGSLALVPAALLHGGLAIPLTAHAVGATAWLTGINAVGGPLVFFTLIRSRGATRTSSLLFLVPAATAVASWALLGQRLGLTALAGLAVAAVGVTLIQRGARVGAPEPATVARPEALSRT